jgi:hypothetical protein
MRLLLPRGTLKKRVPTAPGQTQNDKRKWGLYGAHKPWASPGSGPTGLFPPWPPGAHGSHGTNHCTITCSTNHCTITASYRDREPMVQMSVGGQPVDFMMDTDTEHSMVTQRVAPT